MLSTPKKVLLKRKGYKGACHDSRWIRANDVQPNLNYRRNGVSRDACDWSDGLSVLKTTMNVTYTGSSASATISIFFDTATDQYRCQVVEATNVLVDQALGLAMTLGSPYTVASLVTVIDALANFTLHGNRRHLNAGSVS